MKLLFAAVAVAVAAGFAFAGGPPGDAGLQAAAEQPYAPPPETASGEAAAAETAPSAGRTVVFVIPIHGEINRAKMVFLRREVNRAIEQEAAVTIFDLDTFGGDVEATLRITTLIGSLPEKSSVAYVTTGPASTGVSFSAGAIIALSCSRIYMAPGTSVGAATPVYQSPGGMEKAPEKMVSAIRAKAEALAEMNGYPKGIARAMVDEETELHEVLVDGKMMVLTDPELMRLRRDAELRGQIVEDVSIISESGKLLTLTAEEAHRYGLSSGTVSSYRAVLKDMSLIGKPGQAEPLVIESQQTSADEIVGLLTSTVTASLLVIIALVALYIEVTTPGFGVPGTIGIICLGVVFVSNFLLGRVGSLEVLLFLAGLVLLLLELLVIPGFGVAGISGILLIMVALVLSMQVFTVPKLPWEWEAFKINAAAVTASMLISFIVMAVLAHFMPHLPMLRRLMLATEQKVEQGYTVQAPESRGRLLGKRGVTVTTLRPTGKARLGDELVVVDSEGEFIEPGQQVEVIEVSGNRVVVRKC